MVVRARHARYRSGILVLVHLGMESQVDALGMRHNANHGEPLHTTTRRPRRQGSITNSLGLHRGHVLMRPRYAMSDGKKTCQ